MQLGKKVPNVKKAESTLPYVDYPPTHLYICFGAQGTSVHGSGSR